MKLLIGLLTISLFGQNIDNLVFQGPLKIRKGTSEDYRLIFTGNGVIGIAALEWRLNVPNAIVPPPTIGVQGTSAGKTLQCSQGLCILQGLNANVLSSGEIAVYNITVPTTVLVTTLSIQVSVPLVSADITGSAATLIAGPVLNVTIFDYITDLNGDGKTDQTDIDICTLQILGQALQLPVCTTGDVNGDGKCDVVDRQLIINKRTTP